MLTLGVILIALGLFVFHPLLVIGIIVALVGFALLVAHGAGHGIGDRHYW